LLNEEKLGLCKILKQSKNELSTHKEKPEEEMTLEGCFEKEDEDNVMIIDIYIRTGPVSFNTEIDLHLSYNYPLHFKTKK
jgi:hypothetical protein